LDWLIPPTDRIVILQFLTGGSINSSGSTTQAPFHHPAAQIRAYLAAEDNWWPCSPEFVNYALALLVFSVRYPAVFWNTNKGFSFLFSVQLLANSFQVPAYILFLVFSVFNNGSHLLSSVKMLSLILVTIWHFAVSKPKSLSC
jgi:hypothetical protein